MSHRTQLAALLIAALTAVPASAQLGGSPADSFNAQIRSQALGTGYSVNSIISNNFARASNAGIGNFQLQGSAVSSGFGRTPSSVSLPLTTGSNGTKPFTSLSRSPTVSPFLNLFNTGIGGSSSSFDNYNTLVRPQLDQQRTNRQLQLQNQKLNQKVQAISASPAFQAQGSERIMQTGHSTVFGYYSRFYPGLSQRRR